MLPLEMTSFIKHFHFFAFSICLRNNIGLQKVWPLVIPRFYHILICIWCLTWGRKWRKYFLSHMLFSEDTEHSWTEYLKTYPRDLGAVCFELPIFFSFFLFGDGNVWIHCYMTLCIKPSLMRRQNKYILKTLEVKTWCIMKSKTAACEGHAAKIRQRAGHWNI